MGVFRCVIRHLYQFLLFLIRLPRPFFFFIARLFGSVGKSDRFLRHDRSMGYEEEYDSTWEDDKDHEENREVKHLLQRSYSAYRNTYAAKDMQSFRQRSRDILEILEDWTEDMNDDEDLPNLRFYRNENRFEPHGVYIEDFHKDWFGDYENLEYVHSFIQWIFPIQEKGMNYASRELSLTEIKMFREDEEMKKRLLESYKLMLDFYGIQLVNEETGEVKRAKNWSERFENLNRNTHNNLRITRILKCLGLLGFQHYQAPLVHFFLEETLVEETLPRVKKSALDYFMFAVLDKTQRKDLIRFAFRKFKPREDFVWCPRRICNKFLKEEESQNLKFDAGPNEGMSNETSQSDQNSSVENKEEIETGEDTSNNKHLSRRNDENVPDACQESEKQASPIPIAGNANINKDNEAKAEGDSQHDSHIASEIQNDDAKARNEKIPNSEPIATAKSDENGNDFADPSKQSEVLNGAKNFDDSDENTQTSNHSTTSENAAKGTPLLRRISGSEEQDQGDEFEQGNKDELISQLSEREDSEENLKSGSESLEDNVVIGSGTNNEANSEAHQDAENSADMNSHKYTESDGSIVQSPPGGREQQNPGDELKRTKAEEADENKKDSVHQSMEDDPEDRNTDLRVCNPVTSNNDKGFRLN
ncbi:opioid growth factor receptor-like protein 1 isoform X1 [Hemibagrus wyckioides]|uniref:opioid growth factor receptor-like protein 1 isoform X1 n=1 Tax=Hemibagrus wyckioides TaxID=337641 RepID=UPI00266BBDC3|nr:opioid growth factor receptor-like protein 1 isoform X1 [Hemibagrus wyckioides]